MLFRSFPMEGVQLLLLAGSSHAVRLRERFEGRDDVLVEAFLDRMELAYAAADLVVARAGATTCAELAACGVPSILVPYPFATADHQAGNARTLVDVGAAELVPDASLDAGLLRTTVARLLAEPGTLLTMGAAARSAGRPRAAEDLADLLRSVA